MGRVGVVTVTYGSGEILGELLRSLEVNEPDAPVVVVDNASPEGPPDARGAELIELDRNLGYARACNVGASQLLGEHQLDAVAFLNPDVRLRGPSLHQLLAELRARPRVGVATGPLVDGESRRVPSAWGPPSVARALWFGTGLQAPRLRSLLGRLVTWGPFTSGASTALREMPVDGFVVGGAMVVRSACFREIGGFDPGYFMYGEDVDLCRRARDAGWEVWVLPCHPLVHLGGASSPASGEERWRWYREGLGRYAARHLSPREGRRIERALGLGRLLHRLLAGAR